MLTSCVVGYREASLDGSLPHMTVLDFGPPEIEQFARQWCRALRCGRRARDAHGAARLKWKKPTCWATCALTRRWSSWPPTRCC
ncbi:MAG: hypothetical protein H6641_09700 [Caldilineaceae bacterium]|nr:hypothetical protein [Caldilineaceae bacterium]